MSKIPISKRSQSPDLDDVIKEFDERNKKYDLNKLLKKQEQDELTELLEKQRDELNKLLENKKNKQEEDIVEA